ncbi:MAG: ABC transporter permease [Oscillospiraceae bacterium]|nr:ABC transporter permease [Oscillospiraceae bacterium]
MGAYRKDILREIKNTMGRFISLLIITALGAVSIVGIQAASIDMRAVADKMYKEHNLYDIQLKSGTGFSDDDIAALKNIAGIKTVMPTYVYDVFIYFEDETKTVRTYALPDDLNKIDILDGRLPQNDNECVVEQKLLDYGKYKIGDSITLGLDNMDEYHSVLDSSAFKIVGVVSSPLYISGARGNTVLGDGKLNFYLYLSREACKLNVYTDTYILMNGSQDMDNLTESYYTSADEWEKQIMQTGDMRVQAQIKSDDSPTPEWFYFTRRDGIAFDSYYQDTLRLQKIGYVFPLVFLLVAILVSLTTMSRMVEEHRTHIGIYKALGYQSAKIIVKYLVYAFSAGIIGGIAGVILGSSLFPHIIADAYGHIYDMPAVSTPIPVIISLIAVLAAVGAVLIVTLITCVASVSEVPAELMRPKSPPAGKRVLIEKITFIWNRLGFTGKVTARNIFRYKNRFIMTLVGVAGCSALLLTAFGLRDSVGGVGTLQYENIMKYNSRAYLKDITTSEQRNEIDSLITGLTDDYMYIREESVIVSNFSASLIVPETPEKLSDFINLCSRKTGKPAPFTSDGVLLTEKLAREIGVSAGGSFSMTTGDGKIHTVKVTGVVENYILNYVYMSPDTYKELIGTEPLFNSIIADAVNSSEFSETLLTDGNVRAVVNTDDLKSNIDESTDALRIVTVVLIVLACALALVVLFNLTNINITERIRELATIKVLGFYDSELAMYVYRENGIVTAMGILLGIIGGVWLNGFVLGTAEPDTIMFPHIINLPSYIFAVVLSGIFAVFVNVIMGYKLSGIKMVESLKSVE